MIAEERLPALRGRSPAPRHIFGDRRLANVDPKFEQFAMDPRSAPQWIGQAHIADQLADFQRHPRSAAATARLPSPKQAKAGAMPTNDGLWLHDRQGLHNSRRNLVKPSENQTVELLKAGRFGDFLRSTLSCWRSVRISAPSEILDRKRPMTAQQISFRTSAMGGSIARFAASGQSDRVYDRYRPI